MLSWAAATVRDVPRLRAPFARLLAALLVLGVLALHLPLDALRVRADVAVATTSCCGGCAEPVVERTADAQASPDSADAPVPTDGCDSGCHCGCCGGVPIAAEPGAVVAPDGRGVVRVPARRLRVRRAPPLEVFHPPRA